MYDISFIMPCSNRCTYKGYGNKDYSKRIPLFKEHGLLNIKDKKIKIFLLVGEEDIKDIDKGWGCDVEIVKSNYNHVAHKIHKFYIDLNDEIINSSKWFMQLDDDSMTNVSDLVDRLNKDYNYRDKYNITGIHENDIIITTKRKVFKIFVNMIRKTSYEKIFNKENAYEYAHHGWEHNIFSQNALLYFISELNNKIILEDSLSINHLPMSKYPGDILISMLFNLCDVKLCWVDFLTSEPYFSEFIKKELLHIHLIYSYNNKVDKDCKMRINLTKKIIEN